MNRKKVLFITYGFPPLRRIACIRTWNIAKHLARSGWAVTVLTLDPLLWRETESADAVEAALEAEGIRRLSAGHRWLWLTGSAVKRPQEGLAWFAGGIARRAAKYFGVEPSVGWIGPAERAAARLTPNDVDLVLASGPPFSDFSLARRLAQSFRCPYVLDYRDLWSRHLHHPAPRAVRREAAVIADSAAVITVSPSWARVLDEQFGVGAKVHVVSNGYDPEDLTDVRAHSFGHFAIVYTGSLWPPTRVISPVMAVLQKLNATTRRNEPWMFHYYGAHGQHVLDEAGRFGVKDRVSVHGVVSRARALEVVKGAGVAVVITSIDATGRLEDNGMVTGKIFEPIGLGTPVLIIAPEGSDTNVVAETTGLGRRYAAADVDGIASFLDDLMGGQTPEPKDPAAYAWSNLVRNLDGILREVTGR
jgi:glycosyltransferase involved in cell wall biosynthesis